MKTVQTIEEVRQCVRSARSEGKVVGFIPTLGGLHEGHFSLIREGRDICDFVVVSIFLNPTQFTPGEDLSSYPRDTRQDLDSCEKLDVDLVFTPTVETMYGEQPLTQVTVDQLSETLCGASRPTHFAGVCTVVAKLFNIVDPDKAFFGAKDFQQVTIVRRMVRDLNFPIEIVVCPTIREADGVAMSSRNAYLNEDHRREARELYRSLLLSKRMIDESHPPGREVIEAIRRHLKANAPHGVIDYVQIVDPETLRDVESTKRKVLVALAVKFGKGRLIDNMIVEPGRVAL